MVDPPPGSLRGGGLATQLYTSLDFTALHLFIGEIPHFKEALAIRLKLELLETPIFRRRVNGRIPDSEPWTTMDFNYCLKRLGLLSGYQQSLLSYVLHSGEANAIDRRFL